MIAQMPYILSFVLLFLVVGAVWFILDRRFGTGLYRWWYDLTHQHPFPQNVERGFIFGQPAGARFRTAVILSLLQSLSAVLLSDVTITAEFFTFIFEVPALMLGFYLGPRMDRFWQGKDRVFAKLDELESGKTSVSKEIFEASQRAAKVVRDAVDWDEEMQPAQERTADAEDVSQVEAKEQPVAAESKEEVDPRKMMDAYLRREEERGEH